MSLSAVESAPVEVWLRIIRYALSSPLSPVPGNDILDYRDVFLTVCNSDRAALAHENNANNFRLVCKSWDATVKKLQQKMILCDFGKRRRYWELIEWGGDASKPEFVPLHLFQKPTPDTNELPPVTRIEAWTSEGYCYCFRPSCRYKNVSTSRDHPARDLKMPLRSGTSASTIDSPLTGTKVDDNHLCGLLAAMPSLRALSCGILDRPRRKMMFQQVTCQGHPARDLKMALRGGTSTSIIESLLIGMKVDDDYLCSLLDAMPSLRALSCRIRDKPMWKTFFQRASCQRLTHLQVRVSWAPFCQSLSHIALSELVYLGVVFHYPQNTSDNANPPLTDVKWCAQPKLRYLELAGAILERRQDEFYAFLAVDRPNLSGLIFRVHLPDWVDSKPLVPPSICVPFPNLTSFGVEMAALLVKPLPPAPSMTSVDVILFFSTADLACYYTTLIADFSGSIREMCSEWKPKRIVLPTTWEAEEDFVKCFEFTRERPKAVYLPHYVQFFQVLKEEGITVVDREGRSTETVDGRRYVELLEVHGFDQYDTARKLHEAWADSLPKVTFKPGQTIIAYSGWHSMDSD